MSRSKSAEVHRVPEFKGGVRDVHVKPFMVTIYRRQNLPAWKQKDLTDDIMLNKLCRNQLSSEFIKEHFAKSTFIFTITPEDTSDNMIGFCMANKRVRKHKRSDNESKRYFYIDLFCANGELAKNGSTTRRGAGTALMKVVCDFAAEHKYCHIELEATDDAVGFYKKRGFLMTRNACIIAKEKAKHAAGMKAALALYKQQMEADDYLHKVKKLPTVYRNRYEEESAKKTIESTKAEIKQLVETLPREQRKLLDTQMAKMNSQYRRDRRWERAVEQTAKHNKDPALYYYESDDEETESDEEKGQDSKELVWMSKCLCKQ